MTRTALKGTKLLSHSGKAPTGATAKAGPPILKKSRQWKWNHSHMEARKAHSALGQALRKGIVKRGPCEVCGSLRTDGHHDSYEPEHWLNVRWLCRRHHRQVHVSERRLAA